MSEKQFNLDTVEHAAATPDTELPWAELGLKENEFEDIKEILGRRPTAAEPSPISVTPAFSPIPTIRSFFISSVTFAPNCFR